MIQQVTDAQYEGEHRKKPAILEVNNHRFFSVTPGSKEEAHDINQSVRSDIMDGTISPAR